MMPMAARPMPGRGASAVDEPPELESIEPKPEADGEGLKKDWNYRGPDQTCGSCDHFDNGTCKKGGFQCEEGGGCNEHSSGSMPEFNEEPAELEDLEEL